MDADRARELLSAERERIERALGRLGHEDDSEPADEYDPGNLAADLYQDELNEGLEEDLREQLAAVERAEQRLAAGTYGLSSEREHADLLPPPSPLAVLVPAAEPRRGFVAALRRAVEPLVHAPEGVVAAG